MAPLSPAARRELLFKVVKQIEAEGACAMTKDEIIAGIAALDDFLEANALTLNNALPPPFKQQASAASKALALSAVAMARYGG